MSFAQPTPHNHGHAHVNIVIDHSYISLKLIAPAASLVGFEHQPRSDQEKAVINHTKHQLKQDDLFQWYSQSGWFRQQKPLPLANNAVELHLSYEDDTDHHHANHQNPHAEFTLTRRYKRLSNHDISQLSTQLFSYFNFLTTVKVTIISTDEQNNINLQNQYVLSPHQSKIQL